MTQSFYSFVQVEIPFELTVFDLFKALFVSTVIAAKEIANRVSKGILEVPSIHNQLVYVIELLALRFLTDRLVSCVFHR